MGYTIGTDFIKNAEEKYIGIKFSIGKSLKNFDLHEKNTVYTNILSREVYTIYDYYEKFYLGGGRNSWKSK